MGAVLLLVPASLLLVTGLLAFVAWLEQHVLNPRSMILWAVKVNNSPDHAERMVAAESARLMRHLTRSSTR